MKRNRNVRIGWLLAASFAASLAAQVPRPGNAAAGYILGPDDEIVVHALLVPEITDKPIRIESDGSLNLPLVGRVDAGGLTSRQLETVIAARLRTFVEQPQVSIDVAEQRSQPVSVLGAVKNPGVHQLRGPKSLLEVLAIAGGVEQDAGYIVRIERHTDEGALPLAGATVDPTGQFSVAEMSLEDVMDGKHAAGTLPVKPNDVITVPRARLVYVVGEVKKPGGFAMHEKQNISVLQALSLAEGLTRTAGLSGARVLRNNAATGEREEIPINLKSIFDGKSPDLALAPEDILFVPNSMAKSSALRAVEAAIQMGTGVVIWK
ncbi:MAG: polysaccharide biosynthesis/export family protein [Bryobacteraceae bacterium]